MEAAENERYLNPLNDSLLSISFAAAFWIIRYQLDVSVFTPLATYCLNRYRTKKELKDEPYLHDKFRSTCWKFISYFVLLSIGIYLLKDQPFISDTTQFWRGWPKHVHFPEPLRLFYLAELGLYIFSTLYLPFEPKQKDVWVMFVHHISTISLIVISYIFGFWKIGIVIMTLHDISDPILELAKLFLYTNQEHGAHSSFVVFAIVFIISRCWYFPTKIIGPIWFESMNFINVEETFLPYYPTYYTFVVLLCILQVLHVFWAVLIVMMAVKALRAGKVEKDARDD